MKHPIRKWFVLLPLFLGLMGVILVTRFAARATPALRPLANPPWATNVQVNVISAGTSLQDTPPALAASRVTNDLYAAWPSYSSTGYADVYLARSTDGGQTWGTPRQVNAADHWIDSGESPAIAVSGTLTVHAVWRGTPSMYLETLFYNRSTDGGQTWGTDLNLIQRHHYSDGGIDSPDLATDQQGRLYVAWATSNAFPANYLGLARSSDAGNSWITPTDSIITSTLGVGQPALAVDVTGTLHLAWEEITSAWPDPNGRQACYARSSNNGQTWTDRQCIGSAPTTTTLQTNPDVAVDPFNGRVHAVWQDDRSGAYQIYHVSSGDGGVSWGTPARVSGVFTPTTEPAVSIVADGVVYVVWQDGHNGDDDIYYARSTDGGQTWSAAGRVNGDSGSQPQRHPALAAASDGPRVAWNDFRNSQADIYATSLVSTCAVPLTGIRVSGGSVITPDIALALTAVITPSNATLPVSYNWSPVPSSGQGMSQTSYVWSVPGHYTVTAGASNCGGTFSAEHEVEVLCLAPLTAASLQGPAVITAGTPFVFNATVTPTTPSSPVTYAWSPTPASGQGTLQAHYVWQDVGARVVTFTAVNCGGTFAVGQAVTVRDDVSPTYTSFAPSGWVTTTQTPDVSVLVTDAESGLNVSSGQYAASTDGGVGWSGWSSAAVSGANYVTSPQTMAVSALPFGHDTDSTHQYLVRFRISDMAGHVSASSNYTVSIDTAPPTNPSVIVNGPTSAWITQTSLAVTLTDAADLASGVAGYLTYWSQSAGTVPGPGWSGAVFATATSFSSTVPSDGKDWYLHVRAVDAAGNWATDATHAGPYWFDTTPPTDVTYTTSNPPQGGSWHHNTLYVRWSGGTDYVSKSGGYAYVWDSAPVSTPAPITQTMGTSVLSPALPDGTYYFHIRARDVAGNWTPTAHWGPFKIDTTVPGPVTILFSSPTTNTWSTDNTIQVTWAPVGATDLAGYAFEWTRHALWSAHYTTDTVATTATSAPLDDGLWYFHIMARDEAGNWGPITHYGPFKVDTHAPTNPTPYANHAPQSWSWNPVITETWSGASDGAFGSGVYGYSFVWDASPSTLPPATVNTTSTATSRTLSDGTWYFHIRTRDVAGLWAATAAQHGPFKIDGNSPSNPTSFTSDHTPGDWSDQSQVTVSWSGAADGSGSGVDGYSVVWDDKAGTLPPTTQVSTYGNTSTKDLFLGSNWYIHILTRDKVGNWATTAAHYGPFYIDFSTPHCTTVSPYSSSSRTFTLQWSGQSAWSGVAGFDVAFRDFTTGSNWQVWQSNVTFPSADFTGEDGHVYEFRCRARSNSGVVEDWPTSYQSRTGVATVDFEVIGLELTQAVQDLNNKTLLVAGKRTFARLHVRSLLLGEKGPVTARLTAWRNGSVLGILPPNNQGGALSVRVDPDRGVLDQSFYFDLPLAWVDGYDLTLKAQVNSDFRWAETNYDNDEVWVWSPRFSSVPAMDITMFDVCYNGGGVTYRTSDAERFEMDSWLRRIFPIAQLNVKWGYRVTCFDATRDAKNNMAYPTCSTIDQELTWWRAHDPEGQAEPALSRSYGMVSDAWAFMRGCSPSLPALVASGPSWPPTAAGISNMGSAWYASHELGHDYAQAHTLGGPQACDCKDGCCGCEGGAVGHYANGDISPTHDRHSPNAMYGFDIETLEIYPPTFKDNMTYCDPEWISDYTTYGIYNEMSFEAHFGGLGGPQAMTQKASATGQEYLAVFGTLITETDQVQLEAFYRIPNGQDTLGRVPGEYSIRLLDVNDDPLADYPFTIKSTHLDPGPSCSSAAAVTLPATISEMVPWITGTLRIALLHGDVEIASRFVTTYTPQVTVTFPNGGEVLAAEPFTLTWTASDDDGAGYSGDALSFTVDYSQDGGAHWQTIGSGITSTRLLVDGARLAGGTGSKFRIIATDGVNTGRDDSDGTFALSDKSPLVNVTSPGDGATYLPGQSVALVGSAIDLEDGTLPDAALAWTSSLSGTLGTGHLLHVTDLVTGTHVITLTAADSTGHAATAVRRVRISPLWRDVYLPLVLKH